MRKSQNDLFDREVLQTVVEWALILFIVVLLVAVGVGVDRMPFIF